MEKLLEKKARVSDTLDVYTRTSRAMLYSSLTTEQLRKKFKNNFDLCNFSIHIARDSIIAGHSSSLMDVLDLIEDRAEEASLERKSAR